MDSLTCTIDDQCRRLDDISKRSESCLQKLKSMQEKEEEHDNIDFKLSTTIPERKKDIKNRHKEDHIIQLICPSLREAGLDPKNIQKFLIQENSALARARDASNNAIRSVMLREAASSKGDEDDSYAKPNDTWLDRASAFEEHKICNLAIQMDDIPPIISAENSVSMPNSWNHPISPHVLEGDEKLHYNNLKRLNEKNNIPPQTGKNKIHSNNIAHQPDIDKEKQRTHISLDNDDGAISIGTIMTGNESMASFATASQRRRQRIIAASKSSRDKAHSISDNTSTSYLNDTKHRIEQKSLKFSASHMRQQAMSGSQTYLCDMLHDSHGIGELLPRGMEGDFSKEPHSVSDLVTFSKNNIVFGSKKHSSQRST
eukprot:CAMPEP_0184862246 /NCGR_PEP_ID=MMETSP0580-20130426/6732_1 /TAXON_ID=1118495 /ORGANISM="Dactyliosolen fragilissimus" /LENGTH=370 /DNA_ID=CAMNT_0027360013 /DNA_START=197 /DNA_END=1309 /DNA_ORIENTATION=-